MDPFQKSILRLLHVMKTQMQPTIIALICGVWV